MLSLFFTNLANPIVPSMRLRRRTSHIAQAIDSLILLLLLLPELDNRGTTAPVSQSEDPCRAAPGTMQQEGVP